ncbi:cytochrome C [Algoriphagus sp. D3-2-R+10]|uniref:c-type cytochrome n=1 Tax=Algoriphagus aurantiacus TaxID=3103948 RepID=UPI002B38BB5E|nr:cytochrome C [Algoriphagus sp. D3-2-R+10]MEB2775328.1 cytochrome C [Algoriphagus sp. D3-2-R+10]
MKKVFKFLGYLIVGVLLIVIILFAYVSFSWKKSYDAPYPAVSMSTDSTVLARGQYLVYGPAHCATCHIAPDDYETMSAGELVPLAGGSQIVIPPGIFRPRNLTPDVETGIGSLTNEEVARVMRFGVGHDGRVLFPFMPFENMTEDDLNSIISFLRSRPPVSKKIEASDYTFLGKAVLALGMIKPIEPGAMPQKSLKQEASVVYGEYLANSVANCVGCHSPRDLKSGEFTGPKFSGGLAFEEVSATFITPNLTPDPETGLLAQWTEEAFVQRLKAGLVHEGTPMPWSSFAMMDEVDIKAIYMYLKSLPPTKNLIEHTVVMKE